VGTLVNASLLVIVASVLSKQDTAVSVDAGVSSLILLMHVRQLHPKIRLQPDL
jgi:hypothetical protein